MPAEDRGLPAANGPSEPFELRLLARRAVVVEHGEATASLEDVVGEVGRPGGSRPGESRQGAPARSTVDFRTPRLGPFDGGTKYGRRITGQEIVR